VFIKFSFQAALFNKGKTQPSFVSPEETMPVVNDKWQYVLPNTSEVCLLECQAAFKALTSREKFYSHYMSQASWYGALICLFQVRCSKCYLVLCKDINIS